MHRAFTTALRLAALIGAVGTRLENRRLREENRRLLRDNVLLKHGFPLR